MAAIRVVSQLSGLDDVSLSSAAQGDILYRGASTWNNLAAGTAGRVLKSGGAGANPSWGTLAATDLSDFSLSGVARGDILYRNASGWVNLGAGTSGYFLRTNGAGADPSWVQVDLSPYMPKSGGTFTGAVTFDLSSPDDELIFADTPATSATKSLIRMGSALAGGSASGTYIGINTPADYAGDFFRGQVNGADRAVLTGAGALTLAAGLSATTGTFSGVVTAANGTAGAPGHSFAGSATTGLFYSAASGGSVTTSVAGTGVVRVNAASFTPVGNNYNLGDASNRWYSGYFGFNLYAGYTGSAGYVRIDTGAASNTGYLAFFTGADVRYGYIGYADTTSKQLGFYAENGASWLFSGGRVNVAGVAATANYGHFNVGSGAWDGATSGFFAGSSNGTLYAANAASGYTGGLFDAQIAGVRKWSVGAVGGDPATHYLGNVAAAPGSNPSGGGYLYVEAGSLKFRGSGGTVTTIAPA